MVTEQRFRENLQRILDALNTKDWDTLDNVVDDVYVADYVWHLPGIREPVRGPEAVKQTFHYLLEATPGYRATSEDVLVMGDKAAARLLVHRTDPDTGKAQHRTSLMINHLEDGKFAEDWQLASAWEDDA
jgi:predicted ester cyclase